MTSHPPDDTSHELARALRELLAPPGGDAYWSSLEARILARVAHERASPDEGWWAELARWMRPALVAAAALLLCAGAAMLHSRRLERREAYESLLAATPVPVEAALRPSMQNERDATLRFLLTP